MQTELTALLKQVNAEHADYERLQMLVVVPTPWTVDNGLLTPTLKIRRSRIEALIAPQIDAWYASGETIYWA